MILKMEMYHWPVPNGVEFNTSGSPERFFVSYVNDGQTKQTGLDFNINSRFETDLGTFSAKLAYSHN